MSKIYEALERAGLEAKLPSMPHPVFPVKERRPPAPRIEIEDRMIGIAEALLPDNRVKIIQFLGSRSGEGTSTVVRQFAKISALKIHKTVLVLDADRIHPVQHDLFGVEHEECLNEVTRDGSPIDRAFCRVPYPGISLCLVSGNSVSPSQVLSGHGIWEILKVRFDLVLIDSPPLEVSSDGLALARNSDGVVLVVEAEKTRWPVVENLKNSVLRYGGNILGVVLNKRRYYIPQWIYQWL
ncbi:MAG: tyrosine-protein kinase family protein [Desulfobacteraceae bacterium]|nr:MAG: tyrosine-protein kinase family protein [Desulfobacteraceae bacterium]